jgi:hypothetical protein
VRAGEPLFMLKQKPDFKKYSFYEWLEHAIKDPFKHALLQDNPFADNDLYPTNGIIVPSQRYVTDRVFVKRESIALTQVITPAYNF